MSVARAAVSQSGASPAPLLTATRSASTPVAIGAIYALPFDLINDLAPVTPLPSEPNLIVVRKNFPADNLRELASLHLNVCCLDDSAPFFRKLTNKIAEFARRRRRCHAPKI